MPSACPGVVEKYELESIRSLSPVPPVVITSVCGVAPTATLPAVSALGATAELEGVLPEV